MTVPGAGRSLHFLEVRAIGEHQVLFDTLRLCMRLVAGALQMTSTLVAEGRPCKMTLAIQQITSKANNKTSELHVITFRLQIGEACG